MHQAATLPSFGDVLNIVSQLPLQDKAALMEFLQQTVPLSRHSEIRKLNIYDLKGVGKEIWKGTDAQDYVNQERDSWGKS